MAQRGQMIPRGENTWLLRVFLGRDVTGKKKYGSKTFKGTTSQARNELTKMVGATDQGTFVVSTKQTVQEYSQAWLASKADITEKTILSYTDRMKKDVLPIIGSLRLDKLGPAHISAVYLKMRERNLSPRTIRYTHTVLKQILSCAVEEGLLLRNPCLFRMVKQSIPPNAPTRAVSMTVEEAQKLLDHSETSGDPRFPLWRLLLVSGLRPSEACALKWSDLKDDVITIQRAFHEVAKGGYVVTEATKTQGSVSSVVLDSDTVGALGRAKAAQAEEILKAGPAYIRQGYMFSGNTGAPLLIAIARKQWQAALKAAGLPKYTLYATRHTMASHLLASGASVKDVAERLRHSSPVMLLMTYAHCLPGSGRQLADTTAKLYRTVAG